MTFETGLAYEFGGLADRSVVMFKWVVVMVVVALSSACSGSTREQTSGSAGSGQAGSGGSSGQAGSGAQAGAGGGKNSGDCDDTVPAQACPQGETCKELTPGGFRTCSKPPVEATSCHEHDPGSMDQCCTSKDCSEGKCFSSTQMPQWSCGGAQPVEHNVCMADQCSSDDDCKQDGSPRICVAAGAVGNAVSYCLRASCHTDADCSAEPGGICAPVRQPCCRALAGLLCVYPTHGCRSDSDCPQGHCEADFTRGVAECKDGPAMCPASL